MILMIDNYDSFTYNLVQYFGELGAQMRVERNDAVSIADIARMQPAGIVISPGPGRPEDAGISVDVIREFAGKVPILGVCLGHQAIGFAYGATICRAQQIMHGKTSRIHHTGKNVFVKMPNPFAATRYHSLVIQPSSLPSVLVKTAWTSDGEIMGVAHTRYPLWGVQFHPESILTTDGKTLLRNFMDHTAGKGRR